MLAVLRVSSASQNNTTNPTSSTLPALFPQIRRKRPNVYFALLFLKHTDGKMWIRWVGIFLLHFLNQNQGVKLILKLKRNPLETEGGEVQQEGKLGYAGPASFPNLYFSHCPLQRKMMFPGALESLRNEGFMNFFLRHVSKINKGWVWLQGAKYLSFISCLEAATGLTKGRMEKGDLEMLSLGIWELNIR